MKDTKVPKIQVHQQNRSTLLFHRYGIRRIGSIKFGATDEPRAIARSMAQKVAKQLKLNLGI